MNFVRFPANTTNIFPNANSKTGGQLLTEFNLRSRESVLTSEAVKYYIGPSYCHSVDDFRVDVQKDENGIQISSTTLEITAGRAVVNGHFFESLTNVVVDLAEANKILRTKDLTPLTGRLAIGLRAMYSTEQTLAASLKTENNVNMMTGIQIVILPIGKIEAGYFVLPQDSPDTDELVTAHLKLAEFSYIDGAINGNNIRQNPYKVQAISASRIGEFDSLLAEHFVTNYGLNPKKIYTMAGKSEDGTTLSGKPTWCDSTDSLFVWQKASDLGEPVDELPSVEQAEFGYDISSEKVTLTLPHKQVDGSMWNADGKKLYYKPRVMDLPQADFATNTPGTVSSSYTKSIKAIKESINNFYHLPAGRQRAFVDSVETQDNQRVGLPTISQSTWSVGDYVLVRTDNSVVDTSSSLIQAPSTMYVVLPPIVSDIRYATESEIIAVGNDEPPIGFDGVEVARVIEYYPGSQDDDAEAVEETLSQYRGVTETSTGVHDGSYYKQIFGIDLSGNGSQYRGSYRQIDTSSVYAVGKFVDPTTHEYTTSTEILLEPSSNPNDSGYRGKYKFQDYFCLEIQEVPTTLNGKSATGTKYFYYKVTSTIGLKTYSDPLLLTGTIPLATEDTIGGFYNVPDTALDAGYVYRDEQGFLRILDYALLRSGVLAYQLGEDKDFGTGLTAAEIQTELDEYVNERVAFPTEAQIQTSINNSRNQNVIEVTINLSEEDTYNTIEVKNIDSRWSTSVLLSITGKATNTTTINIKNCQKLRINLALDYSDEDLAAGYGPVINLYDTCLYYDSEVIDYIRKCPRSVVATSDTSEIIYNPEFTGISGLSLWYEKQDYDDPDLLVSDMTVTEVNTPIIPNDLDLWNEAVINDNHYYYGLHSITLDKNSNMIECGIYLRNDMTANIELTKSVAVAQFKLPQGSSLSYPETSLVKQIKITGDFVTAYATSEPEGYITMSTQFTALTHKYNVESADNTDLGVISFLSNAEFIDHFISINGLELGTPIDGWESNSYHVFKGWTIG